jgi:hypothetical protein
MEIKDEEIERLYFEIENEWKNHLRNEGVKFPRLRTGQSFTKDALVLVYLYKNIGKIITKTELTSFIQKYFPDTNDVQQARHLAAQKGWFILSGTRGDVEAKKRNVQSGEYMLVSLKKCYPNFTQQRRFYGLNGNDGWEEIKKRYGYRCATCGSKEGEKNFHYPGSITKLQKGHMDPEKPLELDNIIPQCEKCNRPDRNYFIYNAKGRVIKISDPKFILKSSLNVQKQMYELLKPKFSK